MTMRSDNNLASSPKITEMTVVPVAGYDDMLLNLSGAHPKAQGNGERSLPEMNEYTGHYDRG